MTSLGKYFFTLALALIALPARATTTEGPHCDLILGQIFRNEFRAENIYRANYCHDNIFRLLIQLNEKRINVKKAKVIYVTRDLYASKIFPQAASTNINYAWYYHVLLENQGLIYDFDFTSEPLVVPTEDYFTMMFDYQKSAEELKKYFPSGKPNHRVVYYRSQLRKGDPLSTIFMKAIPAKEYLDTYVPEGFSHVARRGGTDASYFRTTNQFPLLTIRDYLTRASVK